MTIFFDANAGDWLRPEAMAAMAEAAQMPGNPSSVHGPGRAARAALEQARGQIAAFVGAQAKSLIFTSGGTEANALALHALSQGERRVLYGATEHDSVRAAAAGGVVLPVGREGLLDLAQLEQALAGGSPALVAVMLANNETGVIQPIADIARLCHAHGALLHVDAVQALGRMPVDLIALGADSLALSAHKAGGPKGIGALALGRDFAPEPLIRGGGQERGWRGGTHHLPGAMGFAAALAPHPAAHLAWRERIAAAATAAGAVIAGAGAPRLANSLNLILPGVRADLQLIRLDLAGFAVSAGAACSSGKVARSHVLEAMGYGAEAAEAIRVSLSWRTTEPEVDALIAAYGAMAQRQTQKARA